MTKDEALKLALVVLKEVQSETFRLMRNGKKLYAEEKVWKAITAIREALAQPTVKESLTVQPTCKQILQVEQERNFCPRCGKRLGSNDWDIHTCTPPQPEQEPVAWLTDDEREAFERFNETCEDGEGYDVPKTMMRRLAEIGVIHHTSRGIYGITKFGRSLVGYTTPPQPEQEPVAWRREHEGDVSDLCQWIYADEYEPKDDSPNWKPHYTHPPVPTAQTDRK